MCVAVSNLVETAFINNLLIISKLFLSYVYLQNCFYKSVGVELRG